MTKVSEHGGHVGLPMGAAEIIIALHYVFNSPVDKIVYDVSHQSYVHKMVTGRALAFLDHDHYDDVTGYTDPTESEHDFFNIGHTSTSISLASGLATARNLKGDSENIIAIIGDGSLSGGESPNNIFKSLGLDYRFVADGNNLETLINVFEEVKDINYPIVLHIVTQKGKGYAIAEQHKEDFHWTMPFDLETGKPKKEHHGPTYAGTIADYLMEQIKVDPTVVAINAGTPGGFGFNAKWCKEANNEELLAMTKYAVHQHEHPVAIRVPVGKFISTGVPDTTDYSILHKSEVTRHGERIALLGLGNFYHLANQVADELAKDSIDATVVNPKFASGLDEELLEELKANHSVVFTLEDGVVEGGWGQRVASFYGLSAMRVKNYGIAKEFHDRYDAADLLQKNGVSVEQIVADVKILLS